MRGVTFAGMSISVLVKDPHGVAVLNAACLRINRVDPSPADMPVAGRRYCCSWSGTRFIVKPVRL